MDLTELGMEYYKKAILKESDDIEVSNEEVRDDISANISNENTDTVEDDTILP